MVWRGVVMKVKYRAQLDNSDVLSHLRSGFDRLIIQSLRRQLLNCHDRLLDSTTTTQSRTMDPNTAKELSADATLADRAKAHLGEDKQQEPEPEQNTAAQ